MALPHCSQVEGGAPPAKPAGKQAMAGEAKGDAGAGFDAAVHDLRGRLVAEGLFKGSLRYYV